VNMIMNTKIIEFFGLPRTGKTSSIRAIKKYISNQGFSVDSVVERASICPIKDKLSPVFNYWTTFALMKEYFESADKNIQFLLADRGFLDALVWIHYNSIKHNNEIMDNYFFEILNTKFFENVVFKSYFFSAEIETVLDREFESHIIKKEGTILNNKILTGYLKSFSELYPSLKQKFDIKIIDTTNHTLRQTLEFIASDLEIGY